MYGIIFSKERLNYLYNTLKNHKVFSYMCCAWLLSCVQFFMMLWTVAYRAPLSMRFSRPRILGWAAIPPPGNLPNSGIEPRSPALQTDSLLSEPTHLKPLQEYINAY